MGEDTSVFLNGAEGAFNVTDVFVAPNTLKGDGEDAVLKAAKLVVSVDLGDIETSPFV